MIIYKILFLAFAVSISCAELVAYAQDGATKNIFDKFSGAGFKLTRASSGSDKGEPADFGFLTDIGKQTEFHANFFISYRPSSTSWGTTEVTPSASIEGKLSSSDSSAKDAWRFRLGSQFDVPIGGGIQVQDPTGLPISVTVNKNHLWLSLDAKYESDRDFRTKKASAEFRISPTLPYLFIGDQPPHDSKGPEQPIRFQWRPIFETDFGHTFDPGDSTEVNNTILRLITRIQANLFLNFLKKPLGMQDVSIYADNVFFYLPIENQKTTHNYLVTGINFMISKNVGLNFEYKNGEDSPNFVRTHTVGGSLSITF
ncbi:MAG: hypothetical protein NTU60_07480 [Candidatus Aminicenantes bacterium]|nr:hypothetical protein [Candidatus Aminicenantes bacterium]